MHSLRSFWNREMLSVFSVFSLLCSAQDESVAEPKFRQREEGDQGVKAGVFWWTAALADRQTDVLPVVGRGRWRKKSSSSGIPGPLWPGMRALPSSHHFLIKLGFVFRKGSAFQVRALPRFLLYGCSQWPNCPEAGTTYGSAGEF